mmetsp:Transcript_40144/g.59100  ORF Transcript_40144/g.59100 Transcript_40144/m.59100 type:complete len:212 (-) Transcript_40144:1482-2117(-)
MVTGRPLMDSKMPSKSSRWKPSILSSAFCFAAGESAMIICRTVRMRSSELKNMCSVLTSPIPCAPLRRALAASCGESALVYTSSLRLLSTHSIKMPRSPEIVGGVSSTLPSMTSPVLPLSEIQSPDVKVLPPRLNFWFLPSTSSAPTPDTHVLPHPRATTAACDVIPPRDVRMPAARCMPLTSSGLVSVLTRITFPPFFDICAASSAEKTT